MSTAGLALIVSTCSAVVAGVGLIWNIVVFSRTGPRVAATLTMGTYGDGPDGFGKATFSISAKDWARVEPFRMRPDQHFFISARNTGRAAIWVDRVGLIAGNSVTTMNVVTSADEPDPGFGPGLPYKLEAGQTVRWALPLSHIPRQYEAPPLPDTDCVHGYISLGDGKELTTPEGARIGLLRKAIAARP